MEQITPTKTYVTTMDVLTLSRREVSVGSTERRKGRRSKLVIMRDALIKPREREFVLDMEPYFLLVNYAAKRDALIKPREREFVSDMGQSIQLGAPPAPKKEEHAICMGEKTRAVKRGAVMKDVPTKQRRGKYVGSTAPIKLKNLSAMKEPQTTKLRKELNQANLSRTTTLTKGSC